MKNRKPKARVNKDGLMGSKTRVHRVKKGRGSFKRQAKHKKGAWLGAKAVIELVMKFEDLEFEQVEYTGGIQAWTSFRNGFQVSVVRHKYSHGGEKGLYEIGVFDAAGNMCDPLGWGDDVKGWLTPILVEKELDLIASV